MRTICALTTVLLAAASMAIGATTVTTDPVGYVTGTCKANSDTIVSVPLAHAPDFVGTIAGAATVAGDAATIAASGTSPAWTTNQYAALYSATPSYPTYYIKFKTGTLNGKYYTVTANGTNSVTFDTNGDTVTGAVAGDQFAIVKYWTLGDLFPAGTQTTIVASLGTKAAQRRTLLGLPNLTGTGYNLAANQWYYIVGNSWVDTQSATNQDSQILYPDTYFIIRHPSQVTTDTTYTFTGSVSTDRTTLPLLTLPSGRQDNYVAHQRPIGVTLAQSGLASGFMASLGTKAAQWRDMLLVFDNTTQGINKSPSKSYILIGSSWYDTAGANADSVVLEPTSGFIIRKYNVTSGANAVWTNDPNY